MTVKEFLEVVPYSLIDYADIYEERWNEDYNDYDCKSTDKKVKSKKDLDPYLDYKLSYFNYETMYGEYDGSAIYIKLSKNYMTEEEKKNRIKEILAEKNGVADSQEFGLSYAQAISYLEEIEEIIKM